MLITYNPHLDKIIARKNATKIRFHSSKSVINLTYDVTVLKISNYGTFVELLKFLGLSQKPFLQHGFRRHTDNSTAIGLSPESKTAIRKKRTTKIWRYSVDNTGGEPMVAAKYNNAANQFAVDNYMTLVAFAQAKNPPFFS
jgi:hypothetical protein